MASHFLASSAMHPPSSSTEEQHAIELNCVSHGSISLMGRQRSMDDAMAVAPGAVAAGAYDFFAVYGCHYNVAKAYSCRLHKLLAQEVAAACNEMIDWKKVMAACFRKMDEEVAIVGLIAAGNVDGTVDNISGGEEMEKLEATTVSSGSAAAVVVVGKEEIVVASCGGGSCRAVLCGRDSVISLSHHNKLDGQDKMEPVVIRVTKRRESDNFLVIGSHGLWNSVSDEVACLVVKTCLDRTCSKDQAGDRARESAALLATLAIARGSKDNITIVVVQLNTPSGLGSQTCQDSNPDLGILRLYDSN